MTIPDRTVVEAGSRFVKTWRLRNVGTSGLLGVVRKSHLAPSGLLGAVRKSHLAPSGLLGVASTASTASKAGLRRMMTLLRTIPPPRLAKLLDNAEFYLSFEFADCPLTIAQRKELLADMPWAVFTTIARAAADTNLDAAAVVAHLNALSGFDQLSEVLEQHFFKRAQFLRSYRIVRDALQVLNTIKYRHQPQLHQRKRQEKAKLRRFLTFIRQANGDLAVAQELASYLQERLAEPRVPLKAIIEQLEREFSRLNHQLEEYNADFQALQQMEKHADVFSAPERNELRALLGLYGIETNKRLPPDSARGG